MQAEEGILVPVYETMPDLTEIHMPFWNAFQEVSGSRRMGQIYGGIPYSEIVCWLDDNSVFNEEERRLYRRLIAAMDTVFLQHQERILERERIRAKSRAKK